MAKKQVPETKICKHCQTEIPYAAKVCPQCRKKQKKGVLKWILIALAAIIVLSLFSGGGDEESQNVGEIATTGEVSSVSEAYDPAGTQTANSETTAAATSAQTVFRVGDVIQDGDMQIVYAASGVYQEDNEFMQPAEGYQYIFIELACANTGTDGDEYISYFNFACYADGYAVEQHYSGDEGLSATLSPGRTTTGFVYFVVPTDAEEIEIEYETNFLTEEKLTFLYEGEQDAGFVQQANTTRSADAFVVGDVVETSRAKIAYLSCEDWISDNMFVEPKSGYKFIVLTFEFENISDSDFYASGGDFYCYADGISCLSNYFQEDALGASLSAGRKASGTVSFEVPVDAEVIEVEYETNYWTSSRIVFTAQ